MAEHDDAAEAAREWLALLDAGEYQACWDGGSALLRGAVSPGQLAKSLGSALEPMGALQSRLLDDADYHETLPGAPDGRYWVMRFSASYESKQAATETVTASWDGDAWRVIGYFIR
jgi:hypothetical protein